VQRERSGQTGQAGARKSNGRSKPGNVEQPADRMRFTLAHELGHLVMHHDQPTQSMEQEANEFASAFLMPARDIRPHFARRVDLRLFAELKPVWRVSMASLLMRARSLGIPPVTARR
jgi:Zn-dependent peptidase ImmA (M78 family)